MIKNYMTSDDLIRSVKLRAFLPTNQSTFTDEDFLMFANEEMSVGLVPSIMRLHEDYFLYIQEITIQPNMSRFQIPYRAIGSKLRDVSLKDETGNFFEMTRINVGEIPFYNGGAHGVRPYAFYLENNQVVLAPERVSFVYGAKIRLTYYMRPNSLVKLDQVAVISSINTTTGEITLSNIPSTFAVDHDYDIVSVRSPNKTLAFDVQATSIVNSGSTMVMTFDPALLPPMLAEGDHICLAGTTAIPQIPSDLHVILAQRVAARCLEAMGDSEGLQNANAKLAEMTTLSEYLIDNRVEDAPQKINNRHATIRSGLSRRSRFRRF